MLIRYFCWRSVDEKRRLIGIAGIGELAFLIDRSPTEPANLHESFAKVKGSLIASLLPQKLLFIFYIVFTLISNKD